MGLFFATCQKDIIVKDIKNSTVNLLSPPDGYSTPNTSITFWWDEVDGAEKYDIQVVSPSFSSIQQLITDTSTTSDKTSITLTPGTYQWRVRAVNNGGTSGWSTRTLTIDTSSNLGYATVQLISPIDSFYSNQLVQTFSWNIVSNATAYIFSISTNSNTIATTSTTYTFVAEGIYTWSVKAQNDYSISSPSSRTIIIDQTAPNPPQSLDYPITTTPSVKADTLLRWTPQADSYKDIVFISDISDFSHTIMKDTSTTFSGNQRIYPLSNAGLTSGTTYYWKVQSMDKAKNVGNYSSSKSFSVQ